MYTAVTSLAIITLLAAKIGIIPYPFETNQTAFLPPNTTLLPPSISPNPQVVRPNSNSLGKREKIILGASIIAGSTMIIVGLGITLLIFRRNKRRSERFDVPLGDEFLDGIGPKRYSYQELATATCNIEEKNKLEHGGSGQVYKGFLSDLNSFIAVKKITRNSGQGIKQFVAEIKIISQLRHRHTINLIGCCYDRELILVYEFLCNGSLDSHLFKEKSLLTWEVRYKIAQHVALAILYLHEEGDHCILHRDMIKSSNIMLDSKFNAKVGDFGLARLVDHGKGSHTTVLGGTLGFMASECYYSRTNKASKKSDIFSFGITALEIACGRKAIETRAGEFKGSKINIPPTKNNGTQIGGVSLHRKEKAAERRRTATMNDLDGVEVCRKKTNNSPMKLQDESLAVATKLRDEPSLPEEDEQLADESLRWRSPVALRSLATH
ncbi:hypothetical protein EZV62_019312 [Acer yangbiense]|uniref:Protein kinase domain-containing protein n=1 Tax=Acer yangbiense TaxID=1000413 RepID=A0A5C7HCZ0_9ROSI|nr:hypothetical protein EZV62_019312 [Acer yangbiense]